MNQSNKTKFNLGRRARKRRKKEIKLDKVIRWALSDKKKESERLKAWRHANPDRVKEHNRINNAKTKIKTQTARKKKEEEKRRNPKDVI
jgi:hypothetical protein